MHSMPMILSAAFVLQVKLVGSTISCEPVRENGNPYGILRHNAHVQSYAMATDRVRCSHLVSDRAQL